MEDYRKYGLGSIKRDRLEVVSAIIAVTQQPSGKTRIVASTNLNYSVLKHYLKFLVDKGIIEKFDGPPEDKRGVCAFKATEKGNRFLELYCEGLVLLHGEGFLERNCTSAEAYMLQYYRKNRLNWRRNALQMVEEDSSRSRQVAPHSL